MRGFPARWKFNRKEIFPWGHSLSRQMVLETDRANPRTWSGTEVCMPAVLSGSGSGVQSIGSSQLSGTNAGGSPSAGE